MKRHHICTTTLAGAMAFVWIAVFQTLHGDEPYPLSAQYNFEEYLVDESVLTAESPQPLPSAVEDAEPTAYPQTPRDSVSTSDSTQAGVRENDSVAAQFFQMPAEIPVRRWIVGYRFRSLVDSKTSYEFGMPADDFSPGWSPLSRLEFSLNSCWHGLEMGLAGPNREIHFEWLTPQQGIDGELADYDWDPPNADGSITDLGYCKQRWIDGQMLDLNLKFKQSERFFRWPIEGWLLAGFRWQRFNIMCYDLRQVKWDNVWMSDPYVYAGDTISFDQQYYICYIGGQLRKNFHRGLLPPTALILQGDLGYAGAYNVDHHLLREGDRFSMESTSGLSAHLSLSAEMQLSGNWSLGFQADYLQINTEGMHRLLNEPEGVDWRWSDGVSVESSQAWLTVFLRLSI